jgi:hypothetical protein
MIKKYYGGSPSTQTTPQTTSTTTNPWAPAIPAINQSYQQAANLYAQGPQQYTPWSQAAALTPDQIAQVNGTNAYVNSAGTQNLLNQGQSAVTQLLSGSNNPYNGTTQYSNPQLAGYLSNNTANDPSQGINNMMYQNLQSPQVQNNISSANTQVDNAMGNIQGQLQNGYGFGQNMANNYGQMADNIGTTNALASVFDNQNANRLQATNLAAGNQHNQASLAVNLLQNGGQYANDAQSLGLGNYASMASDPISMLQALNSAGGINQTQNQNQINNATSAWNFAQQAPYTNLANYLGIVSPNQGWGNQQSYGTTTTSTPSSGLGTSLGTIGGMGIAAALAPFTGGLSLGSIGLGGSLGGTTGGLLSGGR